MRRAAAGLCVLLLVVVGCDRLISSGQSLSDARSDTWTGMKVLLRPDCLLAPAPPPPGEALPLILIPLIAAVAKPIVDKSLDVLADYLKAQKEAYTATSEAKGAGEFYDRFDDKTLKARFACMIVVRGTFGEGQPREETEREGRIWTGANLRKVALVEPPDLYLELRLLYLGGDPPTHFTMTPVFLDYARSAAERIGGDQSKDILVVAAFKTVDQKGMEQKENTFATFSLGFKKTHLGTRLQRTALSGITTDVQHLPPAAMRDDSKDSKPDFVPFHVLVTLTETENAGAFYLKASEALSQNKQDISKEILNLINKLLQPDKSQTGGTQAGDKTKAKIP